MMKNLLNPYLKHYLDLAKYARLLEQLHFPLLAFACLVLAIKISTHINTSTAPLVSATKSPTLKLNSDHPQIPNSISQFRGSNEKYRKSLNGFIGVSSEFLKTLQMKTPNFAVTILKNGSILMKFSKDYFSLGEHELTNTMKSEIGNFMPKLYKHFYHNPKLRNSIKRLTIYGFSSPYTESQQINGAKKYNQKLALARAREIFNHLFNVEKINFKEQDYGVKVTTISGQGTIALANLVTPATKNKLLKRFCQTNDCYQTRYIMISPYIKALNEIGNE